MPVWLARSNKADTRGGSQTSQIVDVMLMCTRRIIATSMFQLSGPVEKSQLIDSDSIPGNGKAGARNNKYLSGMIILSRLKADRRLEAKNQFSIGHGTSSGCRRRTPRGSTENEGACGAGAC